MASATSNKRKRETRASTTNKRPRYTEPSSSDPESSSSGSGDPKLYKCAIRNERTRKGKKEYCVEWEPSETGKTYPLDWIPAGNALPDLVEDWEILKAEKAEEAAKNPRTRGGRNSRAPASSPLASPAPKSNTPSAAQQKVISRGQRRSRVVESSPAPATPAPASNSRSTGRSSRSGRTQGRSLVAESSPVVPTPAPVANSPSQASTPALPVIQFVQPEKPAVQIYIEPRSDFDPQEYEPFSQLPSSQAEPTSPAASSRQDTQESELGSSQAVHTCPGTQEAQPAAPTSPKRSSRGFWSSGVVPDSQSLPDSASYELSTQTASYPGQTQDTNGVDEEELITPVEPVEFDCLSSSQAVVLESDPIEATDISSQPEARSLNQDEEFSDAPQTSTRLAPQPEVDYEEELSEVRETPSQLAPQLVSRKEQLVRATQTSQPEPQAPLSGEYTTETNKRITQSAPQSAPLEAVQGITTNTVENSLESLEEPTVQEPTQVQDTHEPVSNIQQSGEKDSVQEETQDTTPTDTTASLSKTSLEHTNQESVLGDITEGEEPEPAQVDQAQPQNSCQTNDSLYRLTPQLELEKQLTCAVDAPTSPADLSAEQVNHTVEPAEHLLPGSSENAANTEEENPEAPEPVPEAVVRVNEDIQKLTDANHKSNPEAIDFDLTQVRSSSVSTADDIQHSLDLQEKGKELSQQQELGAVVPPSAKDPGSATESQPPHPQHDEEEQHAQVVPSEPFGSTQDESSEKGDSIGVVYPTIETSRPDIESSPSRHDSSQESPTRSLDNSSSSPPPVPSQSLGTLDSHPPPRPATPINSTISLGLKMDDVDDFDKYWDERVSSLLSSSKAKSSPLHPPPKQTFNTASPIPGTRSPSTIPDRIPQPQIATSLRTQALVNSAEAASPLVSPTAHIPMVAHDTQSECSTSSSLLNDDLELLPEEYIVPLPMNGRQLSCYIGELKRREEDLLQPFLTEPENFDRLDDLQAVLRRLRAIETHVDLLEPLTASSSQKTGPFDQVQWAVTNCVKFKFLSELFDNLRDTNTHILIVIEKENNELFNILEKFCDGKRVGYKYPARAHTSDPAKVEGLFSVTMMLLDSNLVIRPPDAIFCLDGNIDTAQIRKKRWALHPDRSNVPIIHLVIPRTIGHIERYVSPALSLKRRLHTIVASLAQVERDIGRPMTSSPGNSESAEQVAEFLRSFDEDGSQAHIEWPLHSIGSIKDVIEFQSEQSQMSISSPPSNGGASSKRPLDEEYLDPSKRMRMTPTPQATAQADITHISDSMPSTNVQIAKLQTQLEQERKAHNQTMRLKREFENALDRSQTQLEDLRKRHKLILAESEAEKKKAELAVRHRQNLQDRFDKRGEDMLGLRARMQELDNVAILSEDEKTAEIARLMKELREAKEATERAEAKAASAENLRNYMQEQYSDARDRATQLNDEKTAAETERDAYKQQAEVTHVDLKRLHIEDSTKQVIRQIELLRTQKKQLEKLLQQKEDEITKMRMAKGVGMGTRAASVPRSPRVGAGGVTSRGASPLPGGRISNLRNG